jgi:cytochrome c
MAPAGLAIALAALLAFAAPAAAGEALFETRCGQCHTAEAGGRNGVGPNLFGVMGRAAGETEGFRFSKAHRESGAVWDDATMDRYLEDPKQVVPGTLKGFSGMADADARAAVIAYLRTLGE